eukprot:CAMPEP_0178936812 /NCGR_PEP_ID=MMETSP0786-20121207/25393_1 /TAXON_ID=186022 /ORGANISM="Thalassionema frauenfeldii, Strain CCMP 1798" /LENGTH=487 /DNA_ID=CAMNT_0020615281 /DNA_START=327 /DNA_END=1790 /DNA_ORIENTATION=+
MVVKNIIFILQRYGKPMSEQNMAERPFGAKSKDLAISTSNLKKWYSKSLGASLSKHATALGYPSVPELMKDVFNDELEKETGIKAWSLDGSEWLISRMSKMRGQRMSSQTPLLQFVNDDGTMMHTGVMRLKSSDAPRSFELKPLSAALRVSQRTLDAGLITDGSRHSAFLVGLDPTGDGGYPLLKVSLDVSIKKNTRKKNLKEISGLQLKSIERDISNAKVGDGPFVGRVVRLSRNPKAALIDIGMGRSVSVKQKGKEGIVPVLGMLQLDTYATKDNVFKKHSKASQRKEMLDTMAYSDEEETDIDHEDENSIDFDFSGLDAEDFFNDQESKMPSQGEGKDESLLEKIRLAKELQEGDEINVYIQAVSKQSGNFIVTTESQVPKMKEVRKEAKVHKNLERLLAKFEGKSKNILKWKGTEGIGTIKAASQTGNWLYVQPQFNDLPVGIAQLSSNIADESFSVGESVQIRLDGIDQTRGQLALTIVGKE